MVTLKNYHSEVQLCRDGVVNIYPEDSVRLPEFRKFLDRYSEDPESLSWAPPFWECVFQDQEESFRRVRQEGEQKGGIPLSPILAEAISIATGRLPSIPDDLFQMKRLIVERLGIFNANGAYRKFVLWKGAYLLMERTSLPQLGSRFYDSPGDWSAVGRMKKLKVLKIENLAICDWGFLENLGNLQDLNLCGTNFAREDIILRLKNLQQLNLTGTGFTDCSILLQLPKLKRVNLVHCNLKNESALEQLTASVLKS